MGSKILNDKIIHGTVISRDCCPPGDTWSPHNLGLTNDYYPKYVIKNGQYPQIPWTSSQETRCGAANAYAGNEEINAGQEVYDATIIVYKQKDEFQSLQLEWDDLVVDPPVNGWAKSFENIVVIYNNMKMVLNERALENQGITFEDKFYRFNDMYTFDDRTAASDPTKKESLQKSWIY